jgi:DNA-binding response OmpR family regulator
MMEQNILLVEDGEALQVALSDRLRRDGYMVDCASDGETGFQKATSLPFDLMIIDVLLPGRNGLDLCRDIRGAGLGMPILMLTACHDPAIKIAGLKGGADAYLTKPFDMLELSARIEALLRRRPVGQSAAQWVQPSQKPSEPSEASSSATSGGQRRLPISPRDRKLLEQFERQLEAHTESARLAQVIPSLRIALEEEWQTPQTPRNKSFLSAAEGIIEFLEAMFDGIRPPRRRDR